MYNKYLIIFLILFSIIISCKKENDKLDDKVITKSIYKIDKKKLFINKLSRIFLIQDDQYKQQYIILRNNGSCKLIINFCEGFGEKTTTYQIDNNIIKFNNFKFEAEFLSETKLELITEILSFNCNHTKEHDTILTEIDYKYFKPKLDKLRLREYDTFYPSQGKFIRFLDSNEKLLLITKLGNEEIIDGKKGYWYVIETQKNERGTCFSAFLDEIM
jgi:hypothetical protein